MSEKSRAKALLKIIKSGSLLNLEIFFEINGIKSLEDCHPSSTAYPVHYAAEFGHLEIIKYFYRKNLNFLVTTNDLKTVLHFAAGNHHLNVCEFILENKLCDVNCLKRSDWSPLIG